MSPLSRNASHTFHVERFVYPMLAIVVSTCLGCSQGTGDRVKVYPVEGQITLNGRPLEHAFVVLHPRSAGDPPLPAARAQTDLEGRFEVSTYDARDGAAPGEYAVTVQQHKLVKSGDGFTPGPNVLSPRIGSPDSTDIIVTIAEGPNRLAPIEVRR